MTTKAKEGRTKFPAVAPTIEIGPLTFELIHDFAKYTNGKMLMRIADTSATFTLPDGTRGEVGAAMGGVLYFSLGDRAWKCSQQEFASKFLDALGVKV